MSVQKGQGAQTNPVSRFVQHEKDPDLDYLEHLRIEDELHSEKTSFLDVYPKTIVNKVASPDVGMEYSMNPYQGCEHGCTYCYARNSHEYWGYSAGVDFERKILVKKNAPSLVEAAINSPNWKTAPIVMSGNTDCYQPAERKYEITRKCLEVFLKYKHPVSIITKNALIQRDAEILSQLASDSLIYVVISITTLDEELRRLMEPRTASIAKRLETVKMLSSMGVPVSVNMAPLVPGLTTHEIFPLLEAVSNAGARDAHFTMVRLNGQIGEIFREWIFRALPAKASKVLHHIEAAHGGKLNDSQFGRRMKGDGKYVEHVQQVFSLARKKFFGAPSKFILNRDLHNQYRPGQMSLFN